MIKSDLNVLASRLEATMLLCTFLALKLSGKIDWAWLWVLSPVWVTVLFTVMKEIRRGES